VNRHPPSADEHLDRRHPPVRSDFIECLEEKRREDEYEERQNEP
jgi:hypothetical protein